MSKPPPVPRLPRPDTVALDVLDEGFAVRYKTHGWGSVLASLVLAAGFGAAGVALAQRGYHRGPMVGVALGGGLVLWGLGAVAKAVGLVLRPPRFVVNPETLRLEAGGWGDTPQEFPVESVRQIYVSRDPGGSGEAYRLCAVHTDGYHLDLLDGLRHLDVARFLEQELEGILKLEDRTVDGEFLKAGGDEGRRARPELVEPADRGAPIRKRGRDRGPAPAGYQGVDLVVDEGVFRARLRWWRPRDLAMLVFAGLFLAPAGWILRGAWKAGFLPPDQLALVLGLAVFGLPSLYSFLLSAVETTTVEVAHGLLRVSHHPLPARQTCEVGAGSIDQLYVRRYQARSDQRGPDYGAGVGYQLFARTRSGQHQVLLRGYQQPGLLFFLEHALEDFLEIEDFEVVEENSG